MGSTVLPLIPDDSGTYPKYIRQFYKIYSMISSNKTAEIIGLPLRVLENGFFYPNAYHKSWYIPPIVIES